MTLEKYKTCLRCGDAQPNCCSEASMTRETEIAELKKQMQGWTNGCDNCKEACKEYAIDDLKLAMKIIDSLEAENKELKSFSEELRLAANSLRAKTKELEHKYDLLCNFFRKNFTQIVMLNLGDEPELDFLAENKELKEKLGWQPIESAPKDGTVITGFEWKKSLDNPEMEQVSSIWWQDKKWKTYKHHTVLNANPTHWMPLPNHPLNKITGGKNESN